MFCSSWDCALALPPLSSALAGSSMTRRTTRRPVLRSNQLAYVRSGVEQECGGGAVHLGIEQDHVVDAVEGDSEGLTVLRDS